MDAVDSVALMGSGVAGDGRSDRIGRRVAVRWAQGLVEVVRALKAQGLEEGRTARRALGYSQVLNFLNGLITEDEAREATVTGTRKFARRQDQWFRKDPRINWIAYDAVNKVEQALAHLKI